MVMNRMGLGIKNECVNESQQQFTSPNWWVVSQQSQLVVGHEHGNRGICTVTSYYEAMTGEDRTNWEDLVCAVLICRACRLVREL
jgi:hypothetical protein